MNNNWTHKGLPVDEMTLRGHLGFVYRITAPNGKKYIGQKRLETKRRKGVVKKGAKALEIKLGIVVKNLTPEEQKARLKGVIVIKESNWRDYYGSCEALAEDLIILGKEGCIREILQFAQKAGQLSRLELEWQIKEECVPRQDYYNGGLVRLTRQTTAYSHWTERERIEINVRCGNLPPSTPIPKETKLSAEDEWYQNHVKTNIHHEGNTEGN